MYNFDIQESIKKLLGNAKNFLEEFAQSYNRAKEDKKNNLKNEFDVIDEKYKEKIGLNLEKMEYDSPTDEEITTAAKDELTQSYLTQKDKITDTIAKAYQSLEEDKDDTEQEYKTKLEKNDQTHQDSIKNAEKKAVRQGIARSSIIDENKGNISSEKEEVQNKINTQLNNEISGFNNQIEELNVKKEKALNDFELSYATQLQDKITELQKERAEKVEEVTKYNNTITEKVEAYKKQAENDGTAVLISEEKLEAAKKYFDGMPKQQAIEELTKNQIFKKHLGAYYGYMLNYLNNKSK